MTKPDSKPSKVDEFIKRVFPCSPPCDSFGICENCCDAILIKKGAELEKSERDELMQEALALREVLE